MMNKMTLEQFGAAMNAIITQRHVQMLIDMPEGTQEPTVKATGIGTVDFYILMAAIRPVFVKIVGEMGGLDCMDWEAVLDGMWEIIRGDILEQLEGMRHVRNTDAPADGRGAGQEAKI